MPRLGSTTRQRFLTHMGKQRGGKGFTGEQYKSFNKDEDAFASSFAGFNMQPPGGGGPQPHWRGGPQPPVQQPTPPITPVPPLPQSPQPPLPQSPQNKIPLPSSPPPPTPPSPTPPPPAPSPPAPPPSPAPPEGQLPGGPSDPVSINWDQVPGYMRTAWDKMDPQQQQQFIADNPQFTMPSGVPDGQPPGGPSEPEPIPTFADQPPGPNVVANVPEHILGKRTERLGQPGIYTKRQDGRFQFNPDAPTTLPQPEPEPEPEPEPQYTGPPLLDVNDPNVVRSIGEGVEGRLSDFKGKQGIWSKRPDGRFQFNATPEPEFLPQPEPEPDPGPQYTGPPLLDVNDPNVVRSIEDGVEGRLSDFDGKQGIWSKRPDGRFQFNATPEPEFLPQPEPEPELQPQEKYPYDAAEGERIRREDGQQAWIAYVGGSSGLPEQPPEGEDVPADEWTLENLPEGYLGKDTEYKGKSGIWEQRADGRFQFALDAIQKTVLGNEPQGGPGGQSATKLTFPGQQPGGQPPGGPPPDGQPPGGQQPGDSVADDPNMVQKEVNGVMKWVRKGAGAAIRHITPPGLKTAANILTSDFSKNIGRQGAGLVKKLINGVWQFVKPDPNEEGYSFSESELNPQVAGPGQHWNQVGSEGPPDEGMVQNSMGKWVDPDELTDQGPGAMPSDVDPETGLPLDYIPPGFYGYNADGTERGPNDPPGGLLKPPSGQQQQLPGGPPLNAFDEAEASADQSGGPPPDGQPPGGQQQQPPGVPSDPVSINWDQMPEFFKTAFDKMDPQQQQQWIADNQELIAAASGGPPPGGQQQQPPDGQQQQPPDGQQQQPPGVPSDPVSITTTVDC
jgi:hypothetical protein